jgi:hypothetical protein
LSVSTEDGGGSLRGILSVRDEIVIIFFGKRGSDGVGVLKAT